MGYDYNPERERGAVALQEHPSVVYRGLTSLAVGRQGIVVSTRSTALRLMSGGSIIGGITNLVVPQVEANDYIRLLPIEFWAYNPEGSFWDPWMVYIAAKDNKGNSKMVMDTGVRDDELPPGALEGARQVKEYTLWRMPNTPIKLEIRLYGHVQEGTNWSWAWWPEPVI